MLVLSNLSSFSFASCAKTAGVFNSGIGSPSIAFVPASTTFGVPMSKCIGMLLPAATLAAFATGALADATSPDAVARALATMAS